MVDIVGGVYIDHTNVLLKEGESGHLEAEVGLATGTYAAYFHEFIRTDAFFFEMLVELIITRLEVLNILHFPDELFEGISRLNSKLFCALSINHIDGML